MSINTNGMAAWSLVLAIQFAICRNSFEASVSPRSATRDGAGIGAAMRCDALAGLGAPGGKSSASMAKPASTPWRIASQTVGSVGSCVDEFMDQTP